MLIRNLDPLRLCNGTRLKIRNLRIYRVLRNTANIKITEFEKNLDFFIYTNQINIEKKF